MGYLTASVVDVNLHIGTASARVFLTISKITFDIQEILDYLKMTSQEQ
jgi:hypothetical protein